eukprot:Phypoly_transcript_08198.p1 GENE.Phypoly_transcript_08198~~Phypoly_transcript_08198.p1  ORF type:complete len:333 (+),score=39.84 Phypoly_transcript_08198:400-1398(+)
MDSPRSKVLAMHSAEILQSMKTARMKRDAEGMEKNPSTCLDQENSMQVDAKSSTCQLDNCLVCEKDTPFWLLTRNPTWSSIMRVVFYALMRMFPDKQYFSLRTDVYRFVVDHWQKICVSKKRSENWKKQLQDTLSHNKKLFASGYSQYKQNGYWGLRQVIDPWAVSDYADDDDDENTDAEYLEFMALKADVLGELTRMEDRLAEVRDGIERASTVARQGDSLLEDVRAQSEADLIAIGEEIRKMYEQSVSEVRVVANSANHLLHGTVLETSQLHVCTVPQIETLPLCEPTIQAAQFALQCIPQPAQYAPQPIQYVPQIPIHSQQPTPQQPAP